MLGLMCACMPGHAKKIFWNYAVWLPCSLAVVMQWVITILCKLLSCSHKDFCVCLYRLVVAT